MCDSKDTCLTPARLSVNSNDKCRELPNTEVCAGLYVGKDSKRVVGAIESKVKSQAEPREGGGWLPS